MKSFGFYWQYRPAPASRQLADYTADELQRFRDEFYRRRQSQNRWLKPYGLIVAVGFTCTIGGMYFFDAKVHWWAGHVIFGMLVGTFSWFFFKITCPACRNELDQGFGEYCPECGQPGLQKRGWLGQRICTACGRSLRLRKARDYKIRACTYCGVPLDNEGA